MKQATQNKELRLSEELIHSFWARDLAWCCAHMLDDFVWVGSRDGEFFHTLDEFRAETEKTFAEMPQVYLIEESYAIACADTSTCTTVGRYLAFTNPYSDQVLAQRQRFTMVWRMVEGELLLAHFHLSNPLQLVEADEHFPVRAGRETFDFMRQLLRQKTERSSLVLDDARGARHLVAFGDIVYLEAQRQHTKVVCLTKSIDLNEGFTKVLERMPQTFLRVHRSYAVNAQHVAQMYNGTVTLFDGTELSVPASRFADVKRALEHIPSIA